MSFYSRIQVVKTVHNVTKIGEEQHNTFNCQSAVRREKQAAGQADLLSM